MKGYKKGGRAMPEEPEKTYKPSPFGLGVPSGPRGGRRSPEQAAKSKRRMEELARVEQEEMDRRIREGYGRFGRSPESDSPGYKKGGKVKSSASRRADGIAHKGKTKGKMVKMAYGGKC